MIKRAIIKDYLKRKIINRLKGVRLKTPVDVILETCRSYDILPGKIIGLDLFGGHGLWNTYDYAFLCKYLELWEIDDYLARYASRFIPHAHIMKGDSILGVREHILLKDEYNFIFIDNPVGGHFGQDYCEHFDFFPSIFNYCDERTILIFNVVMNTEKIRELYIHDEEKYHKWINKRKGFYGFDNVIKPSLV